MDHILCQLFKIMLSLSQKKHEEKAVNPSIRTYVKKTKDRITFKIKTEYYLEHHVSYQLKYNIKNDTLFSSTKKSKTYKRLWIFVFC